MLSLRTAIGLKQAELANLLGITRLAVGKWEGGINYPKAEHLKKVIALGVKYRAFPAGRETEEIHALWKVAHQRVMLDEDWLSMLLSQPHSPQGQGHEWLHDESAYIAGQMSRKNAVGADRASPCPMPYADPVPCTTGIGNGVGAVACVPCATGLHDPYSPRPTPDKARKQRQWLMHILTALVVLTIIEFSRSVFFAGKR
jgi:transcriptional regulator with XRE-family HTH domain